MGNWNANPSKARWYGRVIGSHPEQDVDYAYGFSDAVDQPDIADLVPEGWRVNETEVSRTVGHPDHVPSFSTEEHRYCDVEDAAGRRGCVTYHVPIGDPEPESDDPDGAAVTTIWQYYIIH